MIYTYFTELFPYDLFPVEYECYKQLKELTNINYIAVPWTQIINAKWLEIPNSKLLQEYLSILADQKINQENNFTVCQHDAYNMLSSYFKHLKITKVFTPLHDSDFKVNGIEFIPISFTNSFNFESREKDILFSFVGCYTTHDMRRRMFNRIKGENIIYRETYHMDSGICKTNEFKKKETDEYKNVLERSRFSLCPRGSSPSSVRFWESMAAGSIPILISNNWVLPDWDWKNTIIKISESNFENATYSDIEKFLKNISPERETLMRENCLKANEEFKKENYKKYILKNI